MSSRIRPWFGVGVACAVLGITGVSALGGAPASAAACPSGTRSTTLTWAGGDSGSLITWPAVGNTQASGSQQVFPNVSGSGVTMTMTITDPANLNADADQAQYPTVIGWDDYVPGGTSSEFGAGYFTLAMNSFTPTDRLDYTWSFDRPVLLGSLPVGDIDSIGYGLVPSEEPANSYQDRIEVFAARAGANVPVTLVPRSPTNLTISGQTATAAYSLAGDGRLAPGDTLGEVFAEATQPVTEFTLRYSNGPADAAAEAGDPAPPAPIPATALGVSDSHGVRISPLTLCTGERTIGDLVYFDVNNSGAKDAGEPGIDGVTVELLDAADAVVSTVVTQDGGKYLIDRLTPTTWKVRVKTSTLPLGTTWTQTADPDVTKDAMATVNLVSGNVLSADFGFSAPLGLISGKVVSERDGGGDVDPGDTGVGNVSVRLTGVTDWATDVAITTTTDTEGAYRFSGLLPGRYTVIETQPAGFTDGIDRPGTNGATSPANDQFAVTLAFGQTSIDNDYFEVPTSSIAGRVQLVKSTTTPISGVTLRLTGTDDGGNAVDWTTTTDAAGAYRFGPIRSGVYAVTETQPAQYADKSETVGTSGGVLAQNDEISAINLPTNTAATGYDFAEGVASVVGCVWIDRDNDGVIDLEESLRVKGITISILDSIRAVKGTAVTGDNGCYALGELSPGAYTIVEEQPAGHGSSTPNEVTLTLSGTTAMQVNFGENLGRLGNFVWFDANSDGVQTAGEVGVAGAVVKLRAPGSPTVIAQTTTDAAGAYRFSDLIAGSYAVEVTPPDGWLFTTANATDDSVDSDVDASTGVSQTSVMAIVACPGGGGGFELSPRFTNAFIGSCVAPGDLDAGLVKRPPDVIQQDLCITAAGPVVGIAPGEIAKTPFVVCNAGPVSTPGQIVEFTVPTSLRPVEASGTGWTCTISGQKVTCRRPEGLAPGATTPLITICTTGTEPGRSAITAYVTTIDGSPETRMDNNLAFNEVVITTVPLPDELPKTS